MGLIVYSLALGGAAPLIAFTLFTLTMSTMMAAQTILPGRLAGVARAAAGGYGRLLTTVHLIQLLASIVLVATALFPELAMVWG